MATVITGYFYDIGGRGIYEDRVDARVVETADGRRLTVGVVADGVGGGNQGERAAQLAKDTFLEALRTIRETGVSALLAAAAQAANQAVYGEYRGTGGASTTLSAAVIDQANTLYIANIGDSRVYLCRKDKLTQLTIDHTFANVMPWQGKMSAELARENPRADVLMLALGPKPQIPVDVGFYVGTTDYNVAAERGKAGLPLKEGDSILVCSDGLIKNSSRTGQPFTTHEEIIRVLSTQEGEKAARSLVSFALGREPEDNISVAVLQMPDPARHQRAVRPMRLAGAVIGALAVLLVIALFAFNRTQVNVRATQTAVAYEQSTVAAIANQTASAQADTIGLLAAQATGTAEAGAATATYIAGLPPTETPTPFVTATPPPTPVPGQIGIFFTGAESRPLTLNDPLPVFDTPVEWQMDSSDGALQSSSIYAQPNTGLEFAAVDAANRRIAFRLSPGSDIFVQTGDYVNEMTTLGTFQGIIQMDPGACLSITYPTGDIDPLVTVSCHGGVCSFRLGGGERVALAAGNQLVFDTRDGTNSVEPIPGNRAMAYRTFLSGWSDGRVDADACGLPRPTATPRATATATATPRPAATDTPVPPTRSGNQPSPRPPTTAPPSTTEPLTSTPPLPTNPSEPPTATPPPPTETPPPSPDAPTNTPEPPKPPPKPPKPPP